MTYKKTMMTTTLSLIAVLAIGTMLQDNVFAEESGPYKMAEGVEAVFTFTFRDGIEVQKFPIFIMGENMVTNSGVSFVVEGVLDNKTPLLHEALDQAYQYRLQTSGGSSYEYDYRYFEVDVDFVKEGQTVKTLNYYNCEIEDYTVSTLNDDYESYMSSKTGFAIIDQIEFNCGGLNSDFSTPTKSWQQSSQSFVDYGLSDYKYADDVRTIITFDFESGTEKIEFPYFELTSGFAESASTVSPAFAVEDVVGTYPLLYDAIDNARKVSGQTGSYNTDFDALVEFVKYGETIRSIDFANCRIDSAKISTQSDKEEGFTGKSGFALVNEIDFDCAGLKPINNGYAKLYGNDVPIWKTSTLSNVQPEHGFPTAGNVHAVATFNFAHGQEVLDFPVYQQGNVLGRANPTFELTGLVGDSPLLYIATDINLKRQAQTGASQMLDLFSVDVDMMVGGEIVRGFNYKECRVTDYVVQTQRDKEESYFKGFALSNTFDFECAGFHPNNPVYDAMFIVEKAKNTSSSDLRNTDDWALGFYVE